MTYRMTRAVRSTVELSKYGVLIHCIRINTYFCIKYCIYRLKHLVKKIVNNSSKKCIFQLLHTSNEAQKYNIAYVIQMQY